MPCRIRVPLWYSNGAEKPESIGLIPSCGIPELFIPGIRDSNCSVFHMLAVRALSEPKTCGFAVVWTEGRLPIWPLQY